MSKKAIVGLILGGAAYATWHQLDPEKKAAIKDKVATCKEAAMDAATDYALEVLDIADGLYAEYGDRFSAKVDEVKQRTQDHTANLVKAVTPETFEEETTNLREQLQKYRDEDDGEEIVIDLDDKQDEDQAKGQDQ